MKLPTFRDAYRRRRCILPVDDFLEWKATKGKMKQPFAIAMGTGYRFGLGGMWKTGRNRLPASGCEPSRSSPSTPMSLGAEIHNGRGTGIGAASRRRSRALRQRLLNNVVRLAMQWALNPHIRTSAHSLAPLLCSSLLRGLFSLLRVQPCADVRIGR